MSERQTLDERRRAVMARYGSVILDATRTFSVEDYARTARRFAKVYRPLLPLNPDWRALDVGCGDGHFLYFLREQGLRHLEGIDTSEHRLARCRRHVVPTVYEADAFEWLRNKRAQYDLVVCNHMVEHFPDPTVHELVEALAGALRPGGKLLVTTPNGCTPWAGYNHYSDLTHVRLFTADSLTQLLGMAGLEACCYPEAAVPYDFGSSLRWLLWKCREALVKLDFRIQIGGTRGRQKTPFLVSPNIFAMATKPESPAPAARG